jgi:hypothetical protein
MSLCVTAGFLWFPYLWRRIKLFGRLLLNLSLVCEINSVILLNIDVTGTSTINYRIWLYFVRNLVWLVSVVKPLTVVYFHLLTVSLTPIAVNYVVRIGIVRVTAVSPTTVVAFYCRSWRKSWFMPHNNNYYVKSFVNFTLQNFKFMVACILILYIYRYPAWCQFIWLFYKNNSICFGHSSSILSSSYTAWSAVANFNIKYYFIYKYLQIFVWYAKLLNRRYVFCF